MFVRRMSRDDADAVAQLHTDAWKDAYRGIIDQDFLNAINVFERADNWKKQLSVASPASVALVAEKNGKVIAFASGLENREPNLLPTCDCELWAIYTLPARKGIGAGRLLLNEFKKEMRLLGKTRLCLWVLKENAPAQQFYQKCGGVRSEVEKSVQVGQQSLPHYAYEFEL